MTGMYSIEGCLLHNHSLLVLQRHSWIANLAVYLTELGCLRFSSEEVDCERWLIESLAAVESDGPANQVLSTLREPCRTNRHYGSCSDVVL